jgi:hypothetical protein
MNYPNLKIDVNMEPIIIKISNKTIETGAMASLHNQFEAV